MSRRPDGQSSFLVKSKLSFLLLAVKLRSLGARLVGIQSFAAGGR